MRGLGAGALALLLMGATVTGAADARLSVAAPRAADPAPLIEAAKSADWEAVRTLLEAGADATATAPDGATALHWASYWDDLRAAELLANAGADINAANDLGATPLWNASLNGSVQMVRSLLDAGGDANAALLSGESPVMTAARTGNAQVVRLLLAAGANPNATAARGQTALMWAASQRHPEAVRALIESGADVRARSETWSMVMAIPPHAIEGNQQDVPHGGNTPLLFAARVGGLSSARLLVEAGADIDASDAWGVSATTLAAHSGLSELVELLLDAGADPDAAAAGFSALHVAVMRRDAKIVGMLLEHGADPNAQLATWTPTRRASRDWSIHPALVGASPFWLAARFSQPDVMRMLAEHGADPLFVHHADYMRTIGTYGAERANEATTALMAAVGMGGSRRMRAFVSADPAELEALILEAVRVAVALGVDVDAVDEQGRTAADVTRYDSVVDLLSGVGRQ